MTNHYSHDLKTPSFLFVDSGTYFGSQTTRKEQENPDTYVIDIYDLPSYDLSPHKILVIDGFADQHLLLQQSEQIRQFLDQGNILLFSGNLFLSWLPGASLFVPKTIHHHSDYNVHFHHPHPIFEGVEADNLTYNKGVSGFFARGHHPIPHQAEVLLTLEGGEPITYIDRYSTKGTILVHSGSNLLGYSMRSNTSGRIGTQLKAWLYEEYEQISKRRITS
ncbi:phosphate starvation-inducible protein PhoH [Brevibacillus daliensis]|uniref:phosphate starvation-inducible protein PhoH n=1 Tax=Brevibacillus daliensis TaxID=2892995 RepID=UPI001E456409|nr:phosphate starvation-inducible protein PhoH [Brevibacillus daliensis]